MKTARLILAGISTLWLVLFTAYFIAGMLGYGPAAVTP